MKRRNFLKTCLAAPFAVAGAKIAPKVRFAEEKSVSGSPDSTWVKNMAYLHNKQLDEMIINCL